MFNARVDTSAGTIFMCGIPPMLMVSTLGPSIPRQTRYTHKEFKTLALALLVIVSLGTALLFKPIRIALGICPKRPGSSIDTKVKESKKEAPTTSAEKRSSGQTDLQDLTQKLVSLNTNLFATNNIYKGFKIPTPPRETDSREFLEGFVDTVQEIGNATGVHERVEPFTKELAPILQELEKKDVDDILAARDGEKLTFVARLKLIGILRTIQKHQVDEAPEMPQLSTPEEVAAFSCTEYVRIAMNRIYTESGMILENEGKGMPAA